MFSLQLNVLIVPKEGDLIRYDGNRGVIFITTSYYYLIEFFKIQPPLIVSSAQQRPFAFITKFTKKRGK